MKWPTPRWQRGLTRIWCAECGRSLDWAPAEFVAKHPDPLCPMCKAVRPTTRPKPATVYATAEVLAVEPVFNTAFEAAVAETEQVIS